MSTAPSIPRPLLERFRIPVHRRTEQPRLAVPARQGLELADQVEVVADLAGLLTKHAIDFGHAVGAAGGGCDGHRPPAGRDAAARPAAGLRHDRFGHVAGG